MTHTRAGTRWRLIPGFWGYRVSDQGGVQTDRPRQGGPGTVPWRDMTLRTRGNDYLRVALERGGRYREVYVHHLVLLAFHGPRPAGTVACRRNGVKSDNSLGNLYYGPPRRARRDVIPDLDGGFLRGEVRRPARLEAADVPEVLRLRAAGHSVDRVAALYDVHPDTIRRVLAEVSGLPPLVALAG